MPPPFPSKIEQATAFSSSLMMHAQCLDAGPPLALVCACIIRLDENAVACSILLGKGGGIIFQF
jgi:hypothetical protein